MGLPKGYLSYNQIRLYQTCPKRYYFAYIREIPSPINEKIYLGVVFHAVVEHYFKSRIAGINLELDELLDVFSDKYENLQKEKEVVWNESQSHTKLRGLSFIKHFSREMATEIDPLMVEKELQIVIPALGIQLRGIIDLVEKDFSITDFKTTTGRWSRERIKKSYLQMIIYKYLFENSFFSSISKLEFKIIYARGAANIRHQELSINSCDFDAAQMIETIGRVAENISSGNFSRSEGFNCKFCEYEECCAQDRCA